MKSFVLLLVSFSKVSHCLRDKANFLFHCVECQSLSTLTDCLSFLWCISVYFYLRDGYWARSVGKVSKAKDDTR